MCQQYIHLRGSRSNTLIKVIRLSRSTFWEVVGGIGDAVEVGVDDVIGEDVGVVGLMVPRSKV